MNPIHIFQVLKIRDKIIVSFFLAILFIATVFWIGAFYVVSTVPVPKSGGEYTEGIVGQPRYINPILSQTSEADADLVELVYSGLFDYDNEGHLVKRLASDYSLSEDHKVYTVTLKQGVLFHDGEELTADDVVYTIQSIQNPAYKSPLRASWQSVTVEAIDTYTVSFSLQKPYFEFLDNLTVGILPKHIWQNVAPENFFLADYNLSPIGSGPYSFFDMDKDSSGNILSYELHPWKNYFEGSAYISKIIFRFYENESSLVDAYKRKEVIAIHSLTPQNAEKLQDQKSTRVYSLHIPRIFGVFFNITKSVPLAHSEVRQALQYATEREELINTVLNGKGQPVFFGLTSFMTGYRNPDEATIFNIEKANALLDENGWVRGEDGIRSKQGTVLEISLSVPFEWMGLLETAELLKEQWEKIGVRVNIQKVSSADLQQSVTRPREYEAVLIGVASMINADLYSFWHSSQKRDPGLNLALFDNKEMDDMLVSLREEFDTEKQQEKYQSFQEILQKENPALFLYTADYLYVANNTVQGIHIQNVNKTASHLNMIKEWYMNTKRVKK